MNFFDALLLGVIQGFTEFLPISSTAHLTIAGNLMGLVGDASPADWTASIAIIQLGTAASVLFYFRGDLTGIARGVASDLRNGHAAGWSRESRLLLMITVGTLPIVVLGLLLKGIIESGLTKDPAVIAFSLIGLALLLLWAEFAGKRTRTLDDKRMKDAVIIGLAQAVALIPGSSRSGTTITAGLFLGFSREAAARFSFLLSIPAVLGSGLYELLKVWDRIPVRDVEMLLVAVLVSGLTGYFAIAMLLRILRRHSTAVFIVYRIALGTAILLFL